VTAAQLGFRCSACTWQSGERAACGHQAGGGGEAASSQGAITLQTWGPPTCRKHVAEFCVWWSSGRGVCSAAGGGTMQRWWQDTAALGHLGTHLTYCRVQLARLGVAKHWSSVS
jgi:hypothetical protein